MRQIHFADFTLDLDLFTLTQDGSSVQIGRRALDLLICLIENRDRVVDKEFLRIEVWNSASLSEAAIPTCILELRKALRDSATHPTYLMSVRGRGYRFIHEITSSMGAAQKSTNRVEKLRFAGRQIELNLLKRCARSVVSNRTGRVILVGGEAGIGKSRLVDEFIDSLQREISCITTKCSQIDGTPPFWPWTQILRTALQNGTPENTDLVAHAQSLATVFPEILGAVKPSLNEDLPLHRFSIITQWIRTVRAITRDGPLLLVFEDIHRADADTLALLACVAEELVDVPMILLATHRPPTFEDDRLQRFAEISDVPDAINLELGPLSESDIASMLDPFEGDKAAISRALRTRTSGNAFYVTHLIRYLDSKTGINSTNSLAVQLPLNGGEIIARQLSDLPGACRETLAVAAIVGERFSIQLLSAALNISPVDAIQQLEPAIRAWIVHDAGPEYEFSHTLLRDALAQNLDAYTKRAVHKSLASELQNRTDAHLQAARISDHLHEAMPLADYKDAFSFAILAARESAARFAYSIAVTYFTRALRIAHDDPGSSVATRCAVMQELAVAMLYTGDRHGARKILLETAQLAREIQSPHALAQCALHLAPDFLSIEVGVHDAALIGLLEESIAAVPASDIACHSKLLARLSQANQWAHEPDRVENLATASLDLARRSNDRDAVLAALAAKAESLHGPSRAEIRLPYVEELGKVARQTGNIPATLLQHTRSITAHLELGDIARVSSENELYREVAAETNLSQYRWYPGAHDSMLAMLRGEIDRAEEIANNFRRTAGERPDQNCLQTFACHSLVRALERDQAAVVIPLLREFAQEQKWMYAWSAALPWFYCDANQMASALETLQRFDESDIHAMSREPGGGVGLALLAETSSILLDERRMRWLYSHIAPMEDKCATVGYGVAYLGSFARYAGLLAGSLGDTTAAIAHLSSACQQERNRGAISWYVYAELDLCRALRAAGVSKGECVERLEPAKRLLKATRLQRATRKLREFLESA